MKWDCGALSKYRNKSPKFRYLSSNPPRSFTWPKGYRDELGIFLATPGVSWAWVQQNFNMTHQRLHRIQLDTKHLHHLGMENAMTATYENALMYQLNKPTRGHIPFWVEPFIVEDLKNGVAWRQIIKKWRIGEHTLRKFRNGRIGDVFYSSTEPEWRKNLGRSVSPTI